MSIGTLFIDEVTSPINCMRLLVIQLNVEVISCVTTLKLTQQRIANSELQVALSLNIHLQGSDYASNHRFVHLNVSLTRCNF